MKRVLVYSHDTFGLGNIRRMLEIARHLIDCEPDLSVLIITGSPMLHAFRIPPRIDYVKLPCLSRSTTGAYGARYLDMTLQSTVRLRANLIRSTILDFEPDLILVDKKPFGVEEELTGALEALPAGMARPKLVLLLRDILDSPEATTRVWRKNRYFEAIDRHYDDVLVVGSPDVFDLRAEYAFPPRAAHKVHFCGYIARRPGRRARAEVRAELGLAEGEPLVLVTAGGGEDGDTLIAAYVEGLAALAPARRPRSHIVFGPEMAAERREAIGRAAARLDCVSRQDFSDDMMSLMDACDVVVSMGGYNTVCELLTLKKRAVVVPRVRPVQEQGIRAERMAALGLLRTVHPDRLTPQHLLETVQQEVLATLHGNGENPTSLLLDGLDEVARAIFRLIGFKGPELATVRGEALPTFTRNIPTWRNSPTTAVPSASW
jgi:predicted glycosyltransferase